MPRFFHSIRFKIGLTLFLFEAAVLMMFGIYYIDRFSKELEQRVLSQLHIPASVLSSPFTEIITDGNLDIIGRLTNQDIIESFVSGSEGIIFFSSDPRHEGRNLLTFLKSTPINFKLGEIQQKVYWSDDSNQHTVSLIDPLIYQGELVGYLYLKADTSKIHSEKVEITYLFIAGSVLCVLFTSLIELLLVSRLVSPRLKDILNVLKSSELGDLSARINNIRSQDEIGTLQRGINRMISSIESRTEELHVIQDQLEQRVDQRTQELVESNIKLRNLAQTDSLTNISSRRYFLEQTKYEIERSQRYQHPLTVMMLDIDYFKKVNDSYGHNIGDKVLKKVTHVAATMIRENDIFGRLGGEEFGLVMPETTLEGGHKLAERIRQAIAALKIDVEAKKINVTVSIGLSALGDKEDSLEMLLKAADDALYYAKSKGRNQVCDYLNDEKLK